jgi:hypothetical protein
MFPALAVGDERNNPMDIGVKAPVLEQGIFVGQDRVSTTCSGSSSD